MAQDEKALVDHIAKGGRITAPEQMAPAYRAEILRVMTVLTDSELAGAAGFAAAINGAPGLAERQALVRIVAAKLEHAGIILALMLPFGVNAELYVRSHPWAARIGRDIDLGLRRIPGDKRLNVFHYPLESWYDALLVDLLVGQSLVIQLTDLADCSYTPLAGELRAMTPAEQLLADLAPPLLQAAIVRDSRLSAAQSALDYWYGRAAATFGNIESERFAVYRRYGIRRDNNAALLGQWRRRIDGRLKEWGLKVPS